ncbi:MAG: hypothetical protein HZA22_09070 [Nitrospirae bacterium]|nr:hypothetical protein [Nitrospirota bacterium]
MQPLSFFRTIKSSLAGRRYRVAALLLSIAVMVSGAVLLAQYVRFGINEHFRGVYLLSGTGGKRYELKNDLFLGEADRLLWGIDIEDPRYRLMGRHFPPLPGRAYLDYEWDEESGDGYVRDVKPDGTEVSTIFSRFVDDDGKVTHGLFLGGALPESIKTPTQDGYNHTGMSYFDGRAWRHIWCSANEAVQESLTGRIVTPDTWRFLGSAVEKVSPTGLIISSRHEAMVDGVPLLIKKTACFRAGDGYFVTHIDVTNSGPNPAVFSYAYGDEPWVGDYGTAAGNVGWTDGQVVETVGRVDTARHNYVGMFHYGNSLIGEGHGYSLAADFIQWFGGPKPLAFFSNGPRQFPKAGDTTPLAGEERFVGLQWGPVMLAPGRTERFTFALGMAPYDVRRGMPVKPEVNLDYSREFGGDGGGAL